jgi:hypothetical protein
LAGFLAGLAGVLLALSDPPEAALEPPFEEGLLASPPELGEALASPVLDSFWAFFLDSEG